MSKFGPVGTKWLKILHLVLVVLFLGGILSSTVLNAALNPTAFEEVYFSYKLMIVISDYVVRFGAQGLLLVGIIYGIWTNWGFFKHTWLTVKWGVFIGQTLIGILVVDKLMVANMAILEAEKSMALHNPVFIHNHELRQYVVLGQILSTIFLIIISVWKPWKKRNVGKQRSDEKHKRALNSI